MKKTFVFIFILITSIVLVSCSKKDNIAPVFNNVSDNKLSEIITYIGSNVDLLKDVTATDDTSEVFVSISSLGNLDFNKVGKYTITYQAVDKSGNITNIDRIVTILPVDGIDLVAPIFKNVNYDYLSDIVIEVGQDIDLLDGVEAIDDLDGKVLVTILDDGNFSNQESGFYTIIYQALDKALNEAIAYRVINVTTKNVIKYDALVINNDRIQYVYNNETALEYTSAGTKFRSFDQVQVMDKDFFINQYNSVLTGHPVSNNNKPFFNSGVIIIVDKNMKLKHMRIATSLIEVDELGVVKTTNLNWTNTQDATNGGGNFANIVEKLNDLIPDGGLIIFAPPKEQQTGKKFLVRNLFYSEYSGGAVNSSSYDVDINSIDIKLVKDFEEVISDDEYEGEAKNVVIAHDVIYDGIPITTYYYNDGTKKPLIFFFHGFAGERKAGIGTRGEELARLGFYVVSLDAHLHGQRQPQFFNDLSYGDKQKEIVNIQIQTALDAKNLYKKYFSNHQYIKAGEVYSFGVSMGAGTAIYLSSIMNEVNTVVSLLGSPSFVEFYRYKQEQYGWTVNNEYFKNLNSYKEHDPLLNIDRYTNKNIYFAGGSKDTTVPAKFASEFKDKVKDLDNITFKMYDTAHSSTLEMHNDAYAFLTKYMN